jgi:hypothetical protein
MRYPLILGRSEILVTPAKSDEENQVDSRPRCVTRILEFHDVDMEDPIWLLA